MKLTLLLSVGAADGEAGLKTAAAAVKSPVDFITGPTAMYTDRRQPTLISLLDDDADDDDGLLWMNNGARITLVQCSTSTVFTPIVILTTLLHLP